MSAQSTAALFVTPRIIRLMRMPASWAAATEISAVARSKATGKRYAIEVSLGSKSEWFIDLHVPAAAFDGAPGELEIVLQSNDGATYSLGVTVGPEVSVGIVDLFHASQIVGWCAHLAPDQPIDRSKLALFVDGKRLNLTANLCLRKDISASSFQGSNDGFAFLMPPQLFDGERHYIEVTYRDKVLHRHRSSFQFALELQQLERVGDRLNGRARVIGTAIDNLELALTGGLHVFSVVKAVPTQGAGLIEFSFDLPALHDRVLCDLTITPRFVPLAPLVRLGDQPLFMPRTANLRQLAMMIRLLPDMPDNVRGKLIDDIVVGRINAARCAPPVAHVTRPSSTPAFSPVSIVIPVYDGIEETRACLDSVHASRLPSDASVTVVADSPPDGAVTAMLRQECGRLGFELIENKHNLGFVATCNAAIVSVGESDVVLLNSDTLVPPDFLRRLRLAAMQAENIASVTPFSNNATILSYPLPHVASPTSADMVERLDRLFAQQNRGVAVDIPTGIGFCMYMRRAAIDDVGVFDPIWGAGYGEENDWCMRAADRGWRHVAAADVFVGHVGGVSFGANAEARKAHNSAVLERRYPDYRRLVQDFIGDDPLWQARLKVDMARLAFAPKPMILHVEHGRGGGLELHIDHLDAQLTKRGARSLRLRPCTVPNEKAGYRIVSNDPPLDMRFPVEQLAAVIRRLRVLGLTDVHFHSFLNLPPEDALLLSRSDLQVTMTFHDYGVICPRVSLTGANGRYCGEPGLAACEACVASLGAHPVVDRYRERYGSVEAWRSHTAAIVHGAERLLAPSGDCAARVSRYLATTRVEVVGGLDEVAQTRVLRRRCGGGRARVGVLGAISIDKGLNELKALVRRAVDQRVPIDFQVIGYTADDDGLLALGSSDTTVAIAGQYDQADVRRLLQEADLDYGLLLSVAPETYCYTLSEFWSVGVPVLAFDIGAPAERIRNTGAGVLVDASASATAVLRHLQMALQQIDRLPQSFCEEGPPMSAVEGYAAIRDLSSHSHKRVTADGT